MPIDMITVLCGYCRKELTLPLKDYQRRINKNKSGSAYHTHCGFNSTSQNRRSTGNLVPNSCKKSTVNIRCENCGVLVEIPIFNSFAKVSNKVKSLCSDCSKININVKYNECSWCNEISTYNAGLSKKYNRYSCNTHYQLLLFYIRKYVNENVSTLIKHFPKDDE